MVCADIFIGVVGSLGGIAQPVLTVAERNAKFSGLLEQVRLGAPCILQRCGQEIRTAGGRRMHHAREDGLVIVGIDELALDKGHRG